MPCDFYFETSLVERKLVQNMATLMHMSRIVYMYEEGAKKTSYITSRLGY